MLMPEAQFARFADVLSDSTRLVLPLEYEVQPRESVLHELVHDSADARQTSRDPLDADAMKVRQKAPALPAKQLVHEVSSIENERHGSAEMQPPR
jgi:hypothetical protein